MKVTIYKGENVLPTVETDMPFIPRVGESILCNSQSGDPLIPDEEDVEFEVCAVWYEIFDGGFWKVNIRVH